MNEKNRLARMNRSPLLLLAAGIGIYLIGILPQYWDAPFTYDFFYTLWRATKVFSHPLTIFQPNFANRFHPLHFLSVAVLYRTFGLNSFVYGFMNGALHILSVLLLFRLVRLIRIPDVAVALAAVFFLFLSTQWGILWDMEQGTRLACISLALFSAILFVQFLLTQRKTYLIYSWITLILSLGFSEDSITLPLFLLVAIPFVPEKKIPFLKGIILTVPFFVVSLAYILFAVLEGTPQGWALGVGLHIPLNLLCMVNEYLHFLFIPRAEFVSSFPAPGVLVRLVPAVLISLFLLAVLNLKKDRVRQILKEEGLPSGGRFLFFGIALTTVTSLIYALRPMSYLWQGRYLYFPGMGIAILGGGMIHKLWVGLGRHYWLKFCFLGVLFYLLVLNIVTTLFMVHKIRSSVNAATKEELPKVFSIISGIRDGYEAPMEIPRNAVLVVEGLPISTPRLKELLSTYYASLPAMIIEAKDENKLQAISRDGRYNVLHLKWQDNHLRVEGHVRR